MQIVPESAAAVAVQRAQRVCGGGVRRPVALKALDACRRESVCAGCPHVACGVQFLPTSWRCCEAYSGYGVAVAWRADGGLAAGGRRGLTRTVTHLCSGRRDRPVFRGKIDVVRDGSVGTGSLTPLPQSRHFHTPFSWLCALPSLFAMHGRGSSACVACGDAAAVFHLVLGSSRLCACGGSQDLSKRSANRVDVDKEAFLRLFPLPGLLGGAFRCGARARRCVSAVGWALGVQVPPCIIQRFADPVHTQCSTQCVCLTHASAGMQSRMIAGHFVLIHPMGSRIRRDGCVCVAAGGVGKYP